VADKALALALGAPEPEGEDMLTTLATDLVAAVKAGDAAGVAEAFKAMHAECMAYGAEE
jgi:hypothetical protein